MKRFMTSESADIGFGDDQLVDVEAVIVLGVGDGALEHLAHVAGDALAREREFGERLLDLLAADQRGDEVQLLAARRGACGAPPSPRCP